MFVKKMNGCPGSVAARRAGVSGQGCREFVQALLAALAALCGQERSCEGTVLVIAYIKSSLIDSTLDEDILYIHGEQIVGSSEAV